MTSLSIIRQLLNVKSSYSGIQRLSRFFYWQIFRKRFGGPMRFLLPDGVAMSVRRGEAGASAFFYHGYADYEEMMFMKEVLKPGGLFVDIGANSGGWSLTAAGFGADAIAIEPVASSYERLIYNFNLNKNKSLQAFHLGLSDKEGELYFTTDADTGNHVTDKPDASSTKVKVTTLDNLLKSKDPSVIKIDVEGHELNVVKGGLNVLPKASLRALIIETFRWANYDSADLREIELILSKNGFNPIDYNPESKTIRDLEPGEGGQNTIYISDKFRKAFPNA